MKDIVLRTKMYWIELDDGIHLGMVEDVESVEEDGTVFYRVGLTDIEGWRFVEESKINEVEED